MVTIANDYLTVEINEVGAEISSIIDNHTQHEYIWQANPAYWNRHAPVLFPIVGNLKDGEYTFESETYELGRHGFARDMQFTTQMVTANSATFYLKSTEETLKKYPFDFSFQVTYILHQSQVTISYEVLNVSETQPLYYSVGGHPAFNVSQTDSGEFDEVYLHVEPAGQYLKLPLTNQGLVKQNKAKYEQVGEDQLTHATFKNDALIYQIGRQTEVSLVDKTAGIEIRLKPSQMEYFGIWSPYPEHAPFICLEPWTGVADTVDASGNLTEKHSITELLPNQLMVHDYSIDFINHHREG